MYKFYDTSSLLIQAERLFEKNEMITISSITLQELEDIKSSPRKDNHIKWQARQVLHAIEDGNIQIEVILFNETMLKPIIDKGLEISNDTKILATAIYYDNVYHPDDVIFVTNDLSLHYIANLFFGDGDILSVSPIDPDSYLGYEEVVMSEESMNLFYSHPENNQCNILLNQYLVVKDETGSVVDIVKWDGKQYQHVPYYNFKSKWFGDVKPYKGDPYQIMLADSLSTNQLTMVKGPAGSGKTFLSLAYLLHLLDKGKIDKIIVFCNTVATKNSARLGFYPGTRDEKLMDSQIGNLLSSKLGDKFIVESLIDAGKLILLPLSDIRGYDTSGMNAGIYISEAQNLDISLIKLALQRVGQDCICIIDGDITSQVDLAEYEGYNNGMRRVSKIFRGSDIYGEITLKNIYRSKIANIADNL